jgi:ribonuclease BN (tRNA processing enzyme)
MRLVTLGGSAAGTGTLQGCSAYLVESDTTSLVLDLGPGTLQQLRAHADYRTLGGIVISHLHADHIADLVALRFTLAYNPVAAPARISLWMPPGGVDTLRRIAQAFDTPETGLEWFSDVFDIQEYDPDGTVRIGDLTCTFHPTVHFIPCWAIRVRPPGDAGDLLYTADTGPAANIAGFCNGASVIVAEATDTEPSKLPFEKRGHLTPAEAARLASDAGAHTLVLTHIFEERGIERVMRDAAGQFAGTILRATPGLEVRWTS